MIACPPSGVATLWVSAIASPPCPADLLDGPGSAASVSEPDPVTDPPMSLTTTRAPRDANSNAYCKPKPPPAPVITATCSSNRIVVAHQVTGSSFMP